jgi:hypothetical protein
VFGAAITNSADHRPREITEARALKKISCATHQIPSKIATRIKMHLFRKIASGVGKKLINNNVAIKNCFFAGEPLAQANGRNCLN